MTIASTSLTPFFTFMSSGLTLFNEGAYLTLTSIYLFQFEYHITLESVPGTNQCLN